MRSNPAFSKEKVGEFIGGHEDLNIKTLSEYVDLLNFENMAIDQGLRYFLDQFTLPGEAQMVDRIIQKFGH